MLHFKEKQWLAFRLWLTTPLGQAFLETEAKDISQLIQTLFGYHLLLMGEPQFAQSIELSPIYHRVWIHPYLDLAHVNYKESKISPLSVRFDKLSIANDSIDVVYLAHCVERIANPHEVIREVHRILLPEGHLIISGINPWSFWGFIRFLLRYIKPLPWDGHFISVMRLSDWLSLLGFEIVFIKKNFFRPPLSTPNLLKRLQFLETIGSWIWPIWGAGYIMVAKKKIITLTPIKPKWEKEKRIVETGAVVTRN